MKGGHTHECKYKQSRFYYRSKSKFFPHENGSVVILKNNTPRYLVIEFNAAEAEQLADNEDILSVSKRLIDQNKQAYELLSK